MFPHTNLFCGVLTFTLLGLVGGAVVFAVTSSRAFSGRALRSYAARWHPTYLESDNACMDEFTDVKPVRCMSVITERAVIGSRLMLLPKGDGFGTHVLALVYALAYCHTKNLTYIHRTWDHVGHSPPGMSIPDWSAELEQFTGLVEHEIKFSENMGPVPAVRWINFSGDIDKFFNAQFLTMVQQRYAAASIPRNNSDAFVATRDNVRVAVHIRRGDIGESDEGRFTSNAKVTSFMQLVERDLREKGDNRNVTFHVYSEGPDTAFADLFKIFGQERVFLHLNLDIKTSFHDMVSADVLLAAKSGFSYSAGLLSSGTIYHQPFWHSPLQHWHILSDKN